MVFTNSLVNATFDIASVDDNPANAGFYCRIGRGQPPVGSNPTGANYYCELSVGDLASADGSGAVPYRLVLAAGFPAFLQQAQPDGSGGWTWGAYGQDGVIGNNIQDCAKLFEDNGRVIDVVWHTFPSQNTMIVILGNGKETLVYRPSNTAAQDNNGVTRAYTSNVNMISGPVRF
jgi:hypothetical protein